jgi:hypothetical protein
MQNGGKTFNGLTYIQSQYIKGQQRKRIGHHNRYQIIQTTKI